MSLSLFLTQLNGFKYLTSVICFHTVYSIWLVDRTLSGGTTWGQIRIGSKSNEEVLHIPEIPIAGAFLSNCLIA